MITLKGIYAHPDQCKIGDATSENNYLAYCKRQGSNMVNFYARTFLYDSTSRAKLAAFVKKAKEVYGVVLVTVDARYKDSREQPGWLAYLDKYASGVSVIEPLTEHEPWLTGDYAGNFYLLDTLGKICKDRGVFMNYYEGWQGSNYSNPQAAVDKMVQWCERIFISNYVSMADYNSTSSTLGKWDSRMKKRCATIAIAAPKFGRVAQIIEIQSLEQKKWGAGNDFLGALYEKNAHSFYGSTYAAAVAAYNGCSSAILQNTDLSGKTIFYSKYALLARP